MSRGPNAWKTRPLTSSRSAPSLTGPAALRARLDGRPLGLDDAEPGRVTERAVRHDRVAAMDAFECRADTAQGRPRLDVAGVGLELDPIGVERLEGVGQLEELGLAVAAAPLLGDADPGPADLEALVFGGDGHVAAAADDLAGLDVDGRERPLDAGFGVGQGRVHPAAQARLVLLAHDRPAPDRRIEGDRAQAREVLVAQRLHPDARTGQDHRLHPRLCWHPRMVVAPLLRCRGDPHADPGYVRVRRPVHAVPGRAVRARSGLRDRDRRSRS